MKTACLLVVVSFLFAGCRHPNAVGGSSGGGDPVQIDGVPYQDPGQVAKTRNAFQGFHY